MHCCLKKNVSTSRPSEYPPVRGENVKTLFVSFPTFSVLVANPEKLLYTVANPAACGLLLIIYIYIYICMYIYSIEE